MAFLLRQLVAGPRIQHPEARLDLCYVTDNIIVTSGPSSTYPQRAYRNPTDALVKFLESKHDDNWEIWEFRAEGTGYPDSEVYNRVHHYPWPDHHPPPFAIIPNVMASMKNWLKAEDQKDGKVVVLHCKAGKGRSGTIATSYLISEEGWDMKGALTQFTLRRMRTGFGPGVSIPSQLRYVQYVDRWAHNGKIYVERPVEITEVRMAGLRDGVKVGIEGYINNGRKINMFYTFCRAERFIIVNSTDYDASSSSKTSTAAGTATTASEPNVSESPDSSSSSHLKTNHTVIFRPSSPLILPSSDVNVTFERRANAPYGWTLVTSVAHCWFNAFFEGHGPEQNGNVDACGTFELEWDALDGIKGSTRKGTRAFDKVSVAWKISRDAVKTKIVEEPTVGGSASADDGNRVDEAHLGFRTQSPAQGLSRAASIKEGEGECPIDDESDNEKVIARLNSDDNEQDDANVADEAQKAQTQGTRNNSSIKDIGIAMFTGIMKKLRGNGESSQNAKGKVRPRNRH